MFVTGDISDRKAACEGNGSENAVKTADAWGQGRSKQKKKQAATYR